jgi:hypothetical protein
MGRGNMIDQTKKKHAISLNSEFDPMRADRASVVPLASLERLHLTHPLIFLAPFDARTNSLGDAPCAYFENAQSCSRPDQSPVTKHPPNLAKRQANVRRICRFVS